MANKQIKRADWHDYRSPGRYMITLVKNAGVDALSTIEVSNHREPLSPKNVYTRWSYIGKAIANQLYNISKLFPEILVEQYSVMPDHVHFLLYVRTMLPEHIGRYIARLKVAINDAAGVTNVFEDGYNDQILKPTRSLNVLFQYIRTNPYRLAVRREYPDFFERRNEVVVDGLDCRAYGNIQLLDNPFKEQVVVHRADNEDTFARNRDMWLHTAANGGVLVSPFISKREKEIRRLAEELDGRLILVTDKPLGEREKPFGRDFELCARGQMLIVAPKEPLTFGREACLKMNSIAEAISQRQII